MTLHNIPPELHSQIRIGIISALISEDKDFVTLKETTRTSDGNLSTHLKKLETGGYIETTRMFIHKKPRSVYSLTAHGRAQYAEYVQMLLEHLEQKQS